MARILIVDDEYNIRLTIRLSLQAAGHTVETASDGTEGLSKYGTGEGWDAVLLDQRMPGMEGLDVLREIRRRDPSARIIMITAFGTVDLAVDAMKAGATDFIRKPFTAEVLREAVRCAVQGPVNYATSTMVTFGMTTLNGFRIESVPETGDRTGGELEFHFLVRSPSGETAFCSVIFPVYTVELVKAYTDREHLSGGARFWQAMAEETIANHVWQNAEVPPDNTIVVEELTAGLKRWADTVLSISR